MDSKLQEASDRFTKALQTMTAGMKACNDAAANFEAEYARVLAEGKKILEEQTKGMPPIRADKAASGSDMAKLAFASSRLLGASNSPTILH